MDHVLEPRAASHPAPEPRVRTVSLAAPFDWLRRGARDLLGAPGASLGVGVVVAAFGGVLVAAGWKATYVAPALLGGFLLVAPFVAIVLYGLSRQLEQGRRPDLAQALRDTRANGSSIALFGLVLALAYLVWERVAAIVFALFYQGQPLHFSRLAADLLSGDWTGLLAAFFAAGALLAAVVFALGVVSAPLLLDRPVDMITATLTSLRCCARNPAPMLLWAALIAALTAAGFATAMIGLVVIFPWLAHASWHAYRDLVEPV
jgi:uncharacterized membrane protein